MIAFVPETLPEFVVSIPTNLGNEEYPDPLLRRLILDIGPIVLREFVL